jgi:hypothetical protein
MPVLDDYVTDILMRDLVGHDRKPVSFLVYLWLAAEERRRNSVVQISYQELAESIGVSKSSAQSAVRWLIRRKLLAASKENANVNTALHSAEAVEGHSAWRRRTRPRPIMRGRELPRPFPGGENSSGLRRAFSWARRSCRHRCSELWLPSAEDR